MDSTGEKAPHQCFGNESSTVCSESIHETQSADNHTPPGGQHNDSGIHKQDGRNEVPRSNPDHQGTMGLLFTETDHTYCRTSAGSIERASGSGVTSIPGQQQLDVAEDDLQRHNQDPGVSADRPVCGPHERTSPKIHQLETGSGGLGNRCIHGVVVWRCGICFPSLLSNRQMPSENTAGPGQCHYDHSGLASTTMVHGASDDASGRTHIASACSQSDHIPHRRTASSPEPRPSTSGLESDGRLTETQGLSEEARNLLRNARRDSSKATYEPPWRKWCSWCDREQVNPVQASVEQVIEFLADKFESDGLQYSTLNLYRSVLSAYHPPIDGFKVGQHPLVRDLLRGAFNTRPPQPRYNETWEVDKVLNTLVQWDDNDQLHVTDLTHKLTMLMALVSASRCSELSLLEVSLMQDHGDKVTFHLGALTTSRSQSRPNQSITFKEYTGNPKIDVVSCLRAYLNKTGENIVTQVQQSR